MSLAVPPLSPVAAALAVAVAAAPEPLPLFASGRPACVYVCTCCYTH